MDFCFSFFAKNGNEVILYIYMKKALLTILLTTAFVAKGYAQFNYVGSNGTNLQVNSNGQYQVGGMVNGNYVQTNSSGGFSINGPGGSLSIGNTSGFSGQNAGGLLGLIQLASKITGMLVPVTIALATLAFFWFLVEFIWKGRESADAHEKGLKGMGYSILAIFVMVSIWGIVSFIGTTIGIGQGGSLPDYKLPGFK